MKNSAKSYHGKNDLEILCLRCIDYCKEHKDTLTMSVLIAILLVVIVIFASTFFKGNAAGNQDQLDQAFSASSTGSAIALPVAPDPAPFETILKVNNNTNVLFATADLYMRRGIYDLQMNMVETPVNPEKTEVKAPKANPNQSFDKAIAVYNEAAASSKATLDKDRAFYSIGVVYEYIASVAKSAEEVKKGLNLAADSYKKVAGSPYSKPAKERTVELAKPSIANFYQKIADKYNKSLTEKTDKTILPNGTGKPIDAAKKETVKDSKTIDEFSIKADASKAADTPKEVKPEAKKDAAPANAPKAEVKKDAPKTDAKKNDAPKADVKKDAK